jgi:hypothetical protein
MSSNTQKTSQDTTILNIMNHLGQEVIIEGISYKLPSKEDLSCANLKVYGTNPFSEEA